MLTPQDRDARLHEMYRNKQLFVFMNGEDWFNDQIKHIHWDWEQSGTWLKVEDKDIAISMIAWELANGYNN